MNVKPKVLVASLVMGGTLAAVAAFSFTEADDGPRVQALQSSRTTGAKGSASSITQVGNSTGGKIGNRQVRPCRYEPLMSAEDMRRLQVRERKLAVAAGLDYPLDIREFAEKLGEKGMWWGVTYDSSDPSGLACAAGLQPYIWVPEGTTPRA